MKTERNNTAFPRGLFITEVELWHDQSLQTPLFSIKVANALWGHYCPCCNSSGGLAMIQYACECGYSLPISAASAGTLVPCRCGRQVKIPKLSELRRLSGQPVDSLVGIADRLRTMYLDKQLPPDRHCIHCQVKTDATLECWVECERARASSAGAWENIFGALLLVLSPVKGLMYHAVRNGSEVEAIGNDLVVRTPLAVCGNCLPAMNRKPMHIRDLLRSVPLYGELLEAYPGANVGAG